MMQTMGWGLATALLTLIFGAMGPAGITVNGEDVTVVDLADLFDGETRTYGDPDHAITATREGDSVTITLEDRDGGERTLDCRLDGGSCHIITTGDGSQAKILALHTDADGGAEKQVEVIVQRLDGDDTGHGLITIDADVMGIGHGDPHELKIVTLGDDNQWVGDSFSRDFQVLLAAQKPMLRCPEGDTTMTLDDEDDLSTYYCPKHNVEMSRVEKKKIERVFIHKDTKDEDD